MLDKILKIFWHRRKKEQREELDIPKITNNKLVDIGDTWVNFRTKKALDRGIPLIVFHKDGTHTMHMPGGELHKKLTERRW